MRLLIRVTIMGMAVLVSLACGQKGPLYLPKPEQIAKNQSSQQRAEK